MRAPSMVFLPLPNFGQFASLDLHDVINLFSPSPSRVKPLVGSTHLGLTYLHVTLSRLRRLYGFYQSELSSFYRTCQLRSTSQRPFCDHDLQVNTSHASTFLFNCHSIALNTSQLNYFSPTFLRSRPTGLLGYEPLAGEVKSCEAAQVDHSFGVPTLACLPQRQGVRANPQEHPH